MPPALKTELTKLTVTRLRSIARELQIKGRSKMTKTTLVEILAATPGVRRLVAGTDAGETAPQKRTTTRNGASAVRSAKNGAAATRAEASRARDASSDAPVAARRAVRDRAPAAASTSTSGGSGCLGLLAVDPTTVFVFWDVDEDTIEKARDCAGDPGGALLLRIHGVANETAASSSSSSVRGRFDLFVDHAKGEQYLEVASPGQTMSCELGVESEDGGFYAFAWSNRLDLPADRQSPAREVRRMRVGGDQSGLWRARGSVLSSSDTSAVVSAAANPAGLGSEETTRPSESALSDTVMQTADLADLLESAEALRSPSSEALLRGAPGGVSSGILGMSSTRRQPTLKKLPPRPAGHIPSGSRLRISLPGLVAPEAGTD